MNILRNLRNIGMLVILTVAGLGLTPPPAGAQGCPSAACGPNITGCHPCAGRLCRSCFDLDKKMHCTICTF
jgi:hypothetical protein